MTTELEVVQGLEIDSAIRPGAAKSQTPVGPSRIMILPASEQLNGADSRTWLNDPEGVVAMFQNPIAIDVGHVTHIGGPAVGWIERLQVVDGAVWGTVKWLAEGAALVASQKYRYISPSIESENGKVTRLLSAGLTNDPNLSELPALNHRTGVFMSNISQPASGSAGGVAESAASDSSSDAMAHLSAIKCRLNLDPSATLDDVLSRIPGSQSVGPVQAVGAGPALANQDMSELLVDAWIAAGKIIPAQRATAIQMARLDPQSFGAYVAAMPQLVSAGANTVTQELGKPITRVPEYLLKAGISADAYRLGAKNED